MQGKSMRVPMPARALPPAQAQEIRGVADSFSLRLRHHNESLHRRATPTDPEARACYDAIERVRYEAIGAHDYAGMRGNLNAATEMRVRTDPITRAQAADDVPLATALSLMLREQLTESLRP